MCAPLLLRLFPSSFPCAAQVVFSMTATLLKFGFVMAIVMLGFAMSFHIIFQDTTFGVTVLDLFKAMLGEVGFFDIFASHRYNSVATGLLVVYLVIVTILLLNLLVAVLSTSHSQVQDRLEQEFNESKGRMIGHYLSIVAEDRLPAPFNLVQLVMTPLFRCFAPEADYCATQKKKEFSPPDGWHQCTRQIHNTQARPLGRVVFWLMLGPVAVTAGAILWIASVGYALYACHEHNKLLRYYGRYQETKEGKEETGREGTTRRYLGYVLVFVWCIVGAPVLLLALWLIALVKVLFPKDLSTAGNDESDAEQEQAPGQQGRTPSVQVERLLKRAPGKEGIEHLSRCLANPMLDEEVRQDETVRITTVEHIKLLRNRIDETTNNELKDLRQQLQTTTNLLNAIVQPVKQVRC